MIYKTPTGVLVHYPYNQYYDYMGWICCEHSELRGLFRNTPADNIITCTGTTELSRSHCYMRVKHVSLPCLAAKRTSILNNVFIHGHAFTNSLHLLQCKLRALNRYTKRCERGVAIAMGMHPRLGDKSHIHMLDTDILNLILDICTTGDLLTDLRSGTEKLERHTLEFTAPYTDTKTQT